MGELTDYLIKHIPDDLNDKTDITYWKKIQNALSAGKGLEAALSLPETEISDALTQIIVNHTAECISLKERPVIENVLTGGKVLAFTRFLRKNKAIISRSGTPIITTNYDRLLELAVEQADLDLNTMFSGQFISRISEHKSEIALLEQKLTNPLKGKRRLGYRPHCKLFKPHGSLDWYKLDDDAYIRYLGALTLPKLLITPGTNKYRKGYDEPFELQRTRANDRIAKSKRLFIIGYGFNDEHLEKALRPQIEQGTKTVILAKNLTPATLCLIKKAPNSVIAIESYQNNNNHSTIYYEGNIYRWENSTIWNLDSFIDEVCSV